MPENTLKVLNQASGLEEQKLIPAAASLTETALTDAVQRGDQLSEALLLARVGHLYRVEAKYLDAESAYSRSIAVIMRCRGPEAIELITLRRNLADLYSDTGQFSQAEAVLHQEVEMLNATGAPQEEKGEDLSALSKVYLGQRNYALARQCAEDALAALNKFTSDEQAVRAALAYSVLGAVYQQYGEAAGAEKSLQQSLTILEQALPPADLRVAEGTANLGLFYASAGANAKGEPLLEKAWRVLREGTQHTSFTRRFALAYAEIERKLGNKKKAKELSKAATLLMAPSPEDSVARYIVDASRLR